MQRVLAQFAAALACAILLITALAPLAFAQMGPKVRFANWEFELPPMLTKVQETREQLVLRLDPSMSGGAAATVTLRAGEPLKGDLAARVDAEWKQLVRNRKLAGTDPPGTSSLADGTEGLRRSARLPGNGTLTLDAYRTPGGVNFMIVDAANEAAAQMIDGAAAMLTMTAKLQPVTAVAGAGQTKPAPGASPPPAAGATASQRAAAGAGTLATPAFPAGTMAAQETSRPDRDVEKIEVPRRDAARLKMVPSRAPTNKELADFLHRMEGPVGKAVSRNAQTLGARAYEDARKRQFRADVIGNIAVGLWTMGNLEAALYLMGKAVIDAPANADNLNNYAALLTMAGGQHLALPILMKLEKDFPGNSTVLNNMAQAWFGLGEVGKAEEYLNKAVMRFPGHSQANFTKAVVAEAKGDKRGAVEAMRKSMAQGYSEEKEAQLERLGHKISEADIRWNVLPKPEPLKLHKFLQLVPPYYKTAADIPRASAEWRAFRETLQAAIATMDAQQEALDQAQLLEFRKFAADMMAGKKRVSPMQLKYTLKHVTYGKLPVRLAEQQQRRIEEIMAVARKVDALAQAARTVLDNPKAECPAKERATTNFMTEANTLWENLQREAKLKELIRWHEEMAQLFMYYNTPGNASYQAYLHGIKRSFLTALMHLNHEHGLGGACGGPTIAKSGRRGPLPHFEDLHCDKNITFSVPTIGSFHVNCHYMSAQFNIAGVVSGTTKEDLITGEFVKGTLEVGITSKKGEKELIGGIAPVSAEGGVEATGFIEFDKNGVSDVGVQVGVKGGVGVDGVPGGGVEVGVTTRMGVNSGVSVQGSGVLSGVSSQTSWRD